MTPNRRHDLGDETGRKLKTPFGILEYRFAPGNTVEIVNIEVEASARGTGKGRAMLRQLFGSLDETVKTVYAITRSHNEIAQQFYEACGFRLIGILRRFYYDSGEYGVDAVMYGRSPRGPI